MKKIILLSLLCFLPCFGQIASPTTAILCGGEPSMVNSTNMIVETALTGTSTPCTLTCKNSSGCIGSTPTGLLDIWSATKSGGTWSMGVNLSSGLRGSSLTNSLGQSIAALCSIGDANVDNNGVVIFVIQHNGGTQNYCSDTTKAFWNAPAQHGIDYDLAISYLPCLTTGTCTTGAMTTGNTAILVTTASGGGSEPIGGFTDLPVVHVTGTSGFFYGEERSPVACPTAFPSCGTFPAIATGQIEHAIDIGQFTIGNGTTIPPALTGLTRVQPTINWPSNCDTTAYACERWYKPYGWYIHPVDGDPHLLVQADQVNYGGTGTPTALGQTFLQSGLFDLQITGGTTPAAGTFKQLLPRSSDPLLTPVGGNIAAYGEFALMIVDTTGKARVWGEDMWAIVTSSVGVMGNIIDAAVTLGSAQNHNEQYWMAININTGNVDALIGKTDYELPGSPWSTGSAGNTNYMNGGPLAGYFGGCNHISTDLLSGGFDFVCGESSSYMQGSRLALPVSMTAIKVPGGPAFPSSIAGGYTSATGHVKIQ